MYYCQDANTYEKVTSVISWNCPRVEILKSESFYSVQLKFSKNGLFLIAYHRNSKKWTLVNRLA